MVKEFYIHIAPPSPLVIQFIIWPIVILFLLIKRLKVLAGIVFLVFFILIPGVGFGWFWPYRITIDDTQLTAKYLFSAESIKLAEIKDMKVTRSGSRGGSTLHYSISGKSRVIDFDQDTFAQYAVIKNEVIEKGRLKKVLTKDPVILEKWVSQNPL